MVDLLAKLEKINEEAQQELKQKSLEQRRLENVILSYQQATVQQALHIQDCRDKFPKLFPEGGCPESGPGELTQATVIDSLTEQKPTPEERAEAGQAEAIEKKMGRQRTLRQMKDNCDFVRGLNRTIGQIREEKVFIDSSIEKVLTELETQKKENKELVKVNAALEELNVAIEKEFHEARSDLRGKQQALESLEGRAE